MNPEAIRSATLGTLVDTTVFSPPVPIFYGGCGGELCESTTTTAHKRSKQCLYLYTTAAATLQFHTSIQEDMRVRRHLAGGNGRAVCVTDEATIRRAGRKLAICVDAQRILDEPNAGGKSTVSEALSMEYMYRRFCAHDVITEMEIKYWSRNWKKVDFICSVSTVGNECERVGVSVTRAMGYPDYHAFTLEDAVRLLRKKLYGLVVAKAGVDELHHYDSSILHVWCQHETVAERMREAFALLQAEETEEGSVLSEDVAVVLTVAADIPEVFTDDLSLFD